MTKFSRILSEAGYKEEILPDGTVRGEDDNFITYIKGGEYHRLDGPALVHKKNHIEVWYLNGKHHRTDGPAWVNRTSGVEEYWVNDREFSKEEFEKHFGGG